MNSVNLVLVLSLLAWVGGIWLVWVLMFGGRRDGARQDAEAFRSSELPRMPFERWRP